MNLRTQTIIQTVLWLGGMALDYRLEGNVTIGGFVGIILGFIVAVVNYAYAI